MGVDFADTGIEDCGLFFLLVPPSPGGSRGSAWMAIFLRTLIGLGRFQPGSGGLFLILLLGIKGMLFIRVSTVPFRPVMGAYLTTTSSTRAPFVAWCLTRALEGLWQPPKPLIICSQTKILGVQAAFSFRGAHHMSWGASPPPQIVGFPEGRGRLHQEISVLKTISQWVGWLPS